jgi:hypothetical protein
VPSEPQLGLVHRRRPRRSAARGAGWASGTRAQSTSPSFCCHASSDRWHSGHGVTIASAPASSACSIGWISSPRAVSSRAGDDREPAALDLRGIVDRLAAAGLDDRLERPRPVGILEAHQLRRAQDLAAVEGRDAEPLEPRCARPFSFS